MQKRVLQARKLIMTMALYAILITGLVAPAPLYAQEPAPATPLQVERQGSDTVIRLELGQDELAASALATAEHSLPSARFGGYQLPMQSVTLALSSAKAPVIEVQELVASDLATPPLPASPETPPALDWQGPQGPPPAPNLPLAPAFVLRSGAVRGQYFAVVAISPIFQENGTAKIAHSMRVVIAGTAPVQEGSLLATAAVPQGTLETADIAVNRAALVDSYRLVVTRPGLQEVPYQMLGLAGDAVNVKLAVNGQEVAVERAGDRLRFYVPSVGDRWNASSTYWLTREEGTVFAIAGDIAPGPAKGAYEEGRWQDNRIYETGYRGADGDHWFHKKQQAPAFYAPGTDVMQSTPVTVPVATLLPLRPGQSIFRIVSTDVTGMDRDCDKPYQYHVQGADGATVLETKIVNWVPAPSCDKQDSSTATASLAEAASHLLLRLHANGYINTSVLLEAVTWKRPVSLNFAGVTADAEFVTDAGAGSFTLTNLPPTWRLYNVTDPKLPSFVADGSGGSYTLNQAAMAPAGRYLLARIGGAVPSRTLYLPLINGSSAAASEAATEAVTAAVTAATQSNPPVRAAATAQQPDVKRHTAVTFGNVKAADAIYIGPAAFADELAPLLVLRQEQGFTPLFVDVQAIYDVYGFGQVSAVAIRNFLRAESDWQNSARQISVVLAGDATYDPFAFGGIVNQNLVAPWMDDVDPYASGIGSQFGEAACDACMAQLNGDNPLTGDNLAGGREWFAADIWIGRFPVRNEQEVAELAAKLVTYDTTGSDGDAWRARNVFLADNYIKKMDEQMNADIDEAGDFAALSDNVVRMLPSSASVRRLYYDPAPDRKLATEKYGDLEVLVPAPGKPDYFKTVPRSVAESWRISDVVSYASSATPITLPISSLVVSTLSGGAGLVAYNGHSNHWQFAITEDGAWAVDPRWMLSINDVRLIANENKPFVMLSMTCYTSQFVKPANNGTLDEVLLRRKDAGAVAVWGPTGLSVVSGHELLQDGFLRQLHGQAAGTQRLGSLVEAGYLSVLESVTSSLDPLMTFVFLGDPLTRARFGGAQLYIPAIQR